MAYVCGNCGGLVNDHIKHDCWKFRYDLLANRVRRVFGFTRAGGAGDLVADLLAEDWKVRFNLSDGPTSEPLPFKPLEEEAIPAGGVAPPQADSPIADGLEVPPPNFPAPQAEPSKVESKPKRSRFKK